MSPTSYRMTGELQTKQCALEDVFQRFPMNERVAQENIVDHHGCRQCNEEKRHAEEKIRQLPLLSLPLVPFGFRLHVRRGETPQIRRKRSTNDETIANQHDGKGNQIVDDHVNLFPFGKDVKAIGAMGVTNDASPFLERCTIGLTVAVEKEKVTVDHDDDDRHQADDVERAIRSADLPMPEEKVDVQTAIDADQRQIPRGEL